ncbi:MAG: hypothetical protein E7585_01790 [Ruminococcaceae bacterium]|nr:hypothetical protein [Oscillospiraceae bacterium]
MKKILCILLCVLTLLPLFVVFASAAEEEKDVILEDLKKFTVNGEPFDEGAYNHGQLEFLHIREAGIDPDLACSDQKFCVYFYFYDPTSVLDAGDSYVYLSFDDERPDPLTDQYMNYFNKIERSKDGRFVRAMLDFTGRIFPFPDLDVRYYYIHRYGSSSGSAFVDRCFVVKGFEKQNNLEIINGGLLTLDLELRGSVYRYENPVSDKDLNTYNEIATVYFTVPAWVLENGEYDYIDSITADFKQYLSTPIIVTNSSQLNSMKDIGVLKSGYEVNSYFSGAPTLELGELVYWTDSNNAARWDAPEWVYNPTDSNRERYTSTIPDKFYKLGYRQFTEIQNALSYYFYNPDIEVDKYNHFYEVLKSSVFQTYLEAYMNAYYPGQTFENGLPEELYSSFETKNVLYEKDDFYELGSFEVDQNLNFWQSIAAFFGHVYGEQKEEKVMKFEVITDPKDMASKYRYDLTGLSKNLKIARKDAAGFLEYLQNAEGWVVCLRFTTAQYECYELDAYYYDEDKTFNKKTLITDGDTWLVRMPFYRDIDVTTVTFVRGDQYFTYQVNADPLDHLDGGVSVKDDWSNHVRDQAKGNLKDWFETLLKILQVIAIIALIALIVYVVVKLFAAGGWLLGGGAKLAKNAKKSIDRSVDKAKKRKQKQQKEKVPEAPKADQKPKKKPKSNKNRSGRKQQ